MAFFIVFVLPALLIAAPFAILGLRKWRHEGEDKQILVKRSELTRKAGRYQVSPCDSSVWTGR